MTMFSKIRAQTITPFFKRKYMHHPNEGAPLDPRKKIDEFAAEPHGAHITGITNFMLYVVVPVVSAVFWYQEYQHYIHRHRPRWPKMDFMNQGVNRWPFGDGKHSCFHHPYYNFTPYGYETDKDGNRLPPGVYAEE